MCDVLGAGNDSLGVDPKFDGDTKRAVSGCFNYLLVELRCPIACCVVDIWTLWKKVEASCDRF